MPIPRTHRRALAVLAAVAAPFAAHPASAAAEPTVTAPDATSIRAGRPLFSLGTGAAGEQVTDIALSTRARVDSTGRLDVAADPAAVRLAIAPGQVHARPARPLHAGRWHWQAWWAAGDGSGATGAGAVQTLTVPSRMRALRGSWVQMSERPALTVRGSVASNARTALVQCSVFSGRSLVTRARTRLAPDPARRTAFRCSDMRVSERLDGKLLTLRVVVRGGGRVVAATARFAAT